MLLWTFNISFLTFLAGVVGLLVNRKTLIQILIALEICLLSILVNFSSTGLEIGELVGLIISLLITVIAAAESSLGLTIIIYFYKLRGSISSKNLNLLKF